MKKVIIKCSECEYCHEFRSCRNSSSEFNCNHPDQERIYAYFKQHEIKKTPGFLGFGKKWSHEVPVKTAPAWCPMKAETSEKIKIEEQQNERCK